MNKSSSSDFAYVGGRPYIRGVDVLRFFLDQLNVSEAERPYNVRSLKLIQELRRNGVWTSANENAKSAAAVTPSATIEYTDSRNNRHQASFLETGDLIAKQVPDALPVVSSIVRSDPFAGTATITPPLSAISLLDGLVTANKAFHSITLNERNLQTGSIRFVYVEGFPLDVVSQTNQANLTISHRGAREKDGRVYTLSVADFQTNDGSFKSTICFSYQPEMKRS